MSSEEHYFDVERQACIHDKAMAESCAHFAEDEFAQQSYFKPPSKPKNVALLKAKQLRDSKNAKLKKTSETKPGITKNTTKTNPVPKNATAEKNTDWQ